MSCVYMLANFTFWDSTVVACWTFFILYLMVNPFDMFFKCGVLCSCIIANTAFMILYFFMYCFDMDVQGSVVECLKRTQEKLLIFRCMSFTCCIIFCFQEKVLSHSSHLCEFDFSCTANICSSKWGFRLNPFEQTLHWNGLVIFLCS